MYAWECLGSILNQEQLNKVPLLYNRSKAIHKWMKVHVPNYQKITLVHTLLCSVGVKVYETKLQTASSPEYCGNQSTGADVKSVRFSPPSINCNTNNPTTRQPTNNTRTFAVNTQNTELSTTLSRPVFLSNFPLKFEPI